MKTNDAPLFDHGPGEESNQLALAQVREKENYHDTVEKISSYEINNEKTKNLSTAQKITIIVFGLACIGFIVGEAIFSWEVFQDRIPRLFGSSMFATAMVIGIFALIPVISSTLLKQPWTRNIPSLNFNRKMTNGPGAYSGRTQGLSRYKIIPKKDNLVWIYFLIGVLFTVVIGYVQFRMSVEREHFHGEIQAYSENFNDNSQYEGYDLNNITNNKILPEYQTENKWPASVWVPLVFLFVEVGTGWALIPMFLILSFWIQTNSLTNKKERHKQHASALFNDVIMIYPSYVSDIEDYNKSYEQQERPVTPNPELKEILHIYDNDGNALTRVTRQEKVPIDTMSGKKDEAEKEPEIPVKGEDTTPNPDLKDEVITDYDFFDKDTII